MRVNFLLVINNIVSSTPDESLFIGLLTKSVIRKRLDEGDITLQNVTKFYASVRAFHEKALEYALDKLPLKDDLLRSGQFVNIVSRESASFPQVEYFIERYSYTNLAIGK